MTHPEQKTLDWLLEPQDAGVRYLALRHLAGGGGQAAAAKRALAEGPIGEVLSHMEKEGYWVKPGPGYYPKYTGTVWSVILLAQLGASVSMDGRVSLACDHVLDHALTEGGVFTASGSPAGTADCLQGNLCAALVDLGCEDPRLDRAFEWMARSVTGDGVAPAGQKDAARRYYAGKCGPLFACGSNNRLACAWGAVKVMLAFGKLPLARRTTLTDAAVRAGLDFLFDRNPANADYPSGYSSKSSGNWWKFGFPVYYVTDILQIAEALAGLGYAGDSRLEKALGIVRQKQDADGRWLLEYDYAGKTWADFGVRKRPNKWVTLRALRVLKAAEDGLPEART